MSAAGDRVIAEAREICAIPAPTFAEHQRGAFVAQRLTEAGVAPQIDAAGNVVAELGGGSPGGAVIVAAHLDTVFAPDTEIVFTQAPGRLGAPGLGDNSLAVAALLHLARRFAGRRLRRPLVLAATVGEEGLGDLRGARVLVAERPCQAFVALEGQMLDTITVAGVGSVRLVVTVRGPGGHPWSNRGTPSAIHALVAGLDRAVGEAQRLGVVVNVGVIAGGTVINAIAGQARTEIDLRSESADPLTQATERVRAALQDVPAGLAVTVEQVGHRPSGRTPADHPLVRAARGARERVGLPAAPECASSTDANAAHGRGIPAITVGVTTGGNAHRLDEYIDLEPVSDGVAALEVLLDDLVGAPDR